MEEVGESVLNLVKQGNDEKFEMLVQHYEQPVYQLSYIWMGNEACAEKLARDTFLYAYANMAEYFRKEMAYSVWLFRIVICLGKKRKAEINRREAITPLLHVPLEERITLFLFHVYQLPLCEIAKVLESNQADIRVFLKYGRKELSEVVKNKEYSIC